MMRSFPPVALLAAALLGSTVAPSGVHAQVEVDHELVELVGAREIAFARTMADRDLEAFATFLSDEAIFFTGSGRALRGKAAVVEAWSRLFEGADPPFSWAPDVVEVLESGTLALSSGPVLGPDGEQTGRFNSIWRLEADGVWRVVFDRGS
jgi:ketosteroid isomerase-like protein